MGRGGELLLLVLPVLLVVLLVLATFRSSSVRLLGVTAGVCGAWLVMFLADVFVVRPIPTIAWGGYVLVVLMAGTAVSGRWRVSDQGRAVTW
jgi:hypothetical protein